MRRGEVYWFDFGRPAKRRPVLVLTGTRSLPNLSTVTVAALSTTIRGVKSEVPLDESHGLPRPCAVNLHQLHTVEQAELEGFVTQLPDEVMGKVEASLLFCLAFGVRVGDG